MSPLSSKEKKMVSTLLTSHKEIFEVADFIESEFPGGYLEISSFQQRLVIMPSDKTTVDSLMAHLISVRELLNKLEASGYIHSWQSLPVEDNMRRMGQQTLSGSTQFLPDFTLASALLLQANRKFSIHDDLRRLARRRFLPESEVRHRQLLHTLIGGIALLVATGLFQTLVGYQQGQKSTHAYLKGLRQSKKILVSNQTMTRKILDSLNHQNRQLRLLTLVTSRYSKEFNNFRGTYNGHRQLLVQLGREQRKVNEIVDRNAFLLVKTDSLLNKMASK